MDKLSGRVLVIDQDPGIYNVCSDVTVPMEKIMDLLVDMSSAEISLKEDPLLIHRDAPGVFPHPSYDKLQRSTAWGPTTSLSAMMSDVLSYWRSR